MEPRYTITLSEHFELENWTFEVSIKDWHTEHEEVFKMTPVDNLCLASEPVFIDTLIVAKAINQFITQQQELSFERAEEIALTPPWDRDWSTDWDEAEMSDCVEGSTFYNLG